MRKLILAFLFCISSVFAANLHIIAYRGDTIMMEYKFENIKTWSWMTDQQGHKFIRVDLYGNNFVDLPINDYEIKIQK